MSMIVEVTVNHQVNCDIDCVNGCILGEKCPNREHAKQASKFIENTSLEKMLQIAEEARLKKMSQPPQWVIPEDF
ncbi:diaminopimelate epimerase [Aphanothece sacrum FPU1]|uniref:Diaminopimelate epimerase n=1 Tax=Aphanothece sacrum FPU1 TaxID=1920663 RepID=A0A401IBW4_APHSA|nr:diaminopimelate epimerase [Aphanothece sacrum FPU1]GBF82971.1 diaminopimelate epimerase [Aphanothece sacrum FPU3]